MPIFIDLTGKVFGRLVVLKRNGYQGKEIQWLCLCKCGKETNVKGSNLKNGHTKSCGCLMIERARCANMKHGHYGTKIYKTWASIIQRCTNTNYTEYRYYGGRGITVCERWLKFENFLEDVGEHPGGIYSIDRINNSKGYFPDNWRWATPKQQANNRRKINE